MPLFSVASPRDRSIHPRSASTAFPRSRATTCVVALSLALLPGSPLPSLVAQVPGAALVANDRVPPAVTEGLRERQAPQQIRTDLRPDQRGDIFMARKVYRSAVDSYQEGLAEITAQRAEFLRLSAASLRQLNRDAEARSAESTARELQKRSTEHTTKSNALPGGSGNLFTRLLMALGLMSASPAAPTGASVDPPDSPREVDGVPMPENLTPQQQAAFLASHGRHQDALALYQHLDSQLTRRQAVLWNKVGIAYHQMLDMDAAARCYRESLRTDARYSEARNNLGTVHYTQKQYGRAVNEYRKSLDLTPNSASVHSNLGTAYFAQKRYEEASTHYARAVEIDPMIFEHRGSQGTILQQRNVEDRASFHFYLAKVYARNGDVERSLLYMRKALEDGFKDRRKFRDDTDFAAMQEIEEFQTLLATEFRVL
ncbi:MAG: tetratricopeptide repeat protein [Bryobacterales bacterium]|jgi:tetratricopeptide (TPR) repeat protein|nr:tetratricopeptide repeat protein [Bryobacterales bacterium]